MLHHTKVRHTILRQMGVIDSVMDDCVLSTVKCLLQGSLAGTLQHMLSYIDSRHFV